MLRAVCIQKLDVEKTSLSWSLIPSNEIRKPVFHLISSYRSLRFIILLYTPLQALLLMFLLSVMFLFWKTIKSWLLLKWNKKHIIYPELPTKCHDKSASSIAQSRENNLKRIPCTQRQLQVELFPFCWNQFYWDYCLSRQASTVPSFCVVQCTVHAGILLTPLQRHTHTVQLSSVPPKFTGLFLATAKIKLTSVALNL